MTRNNSLLLATAAVVALAGYPLTATAAPADGSMRLAQAPQNSNDAEKKKQPPQQAPKPAPQPHQAPPPQPHPAQQVQPHPAQQAQPKVVQPQQAQPHPAQQVQPKVVQPQQAQPKTLPPQHAQPKSDQPHQAQPKSNQPQQAQPKSTQQQQVQPKVVQPQQGQPKSVQPQQAQPKTVQPQAQPKTVQPQPNSNQPQQAQPKPGVQQQQQQVQPNPAVKLPPQQQQQVNRAAAPPPPQKPVNSSQFIRGKGPQQGPAPTLTELRKERHEVRVGNQVIVQEGNRTIVRENNRLIIRHNEADRFAVGARNVRVDRRGNQTVSTIVRPNGISIITYTDANGHLLRRVRRDRNGHEVIIIDESFAGSEPTYYVDVRPPVIRIPRERYIIEADRAPPQEIYEVLMAPPVSQVEQRYTVQQVLYSAPLRQYMSRVDLDINFDTGSWQLAPDQVDKLAAMAEDLNRAISANPKEVFLIEGHTDAVGSDEDNLSLSDRRAEAVAVALTEQFQVPPENLVTQGYGESELKVQTQAAERANRRVAIRRITPLIDKQAAR